MVCWILLDVTDPRSDRQFMVNAFGILKKYHLQLCTVDRLYFVRHKLAFTALCN
jgi:hypothetical protein